jgi:transcriptional regulator with XRE-family HTH domain
MDLKELRLSKNISATELAARARVSRALVQLCERGYTPGPLPRESLARALGVTEAELFGDRS